MLKFDFYPDKIGIESNEDGFTPDDIHAICSVGGSIKFGTQACGGERGIGFKSVFMITSKVYIQSEPYSFYFEHEKDEKGIDLITPVYPKPDEELHILRLE